MNIRYVTVTYDKYWNQLVVGLAKYNTKERGVVKWERLFGIGIAYHVTVN